MRLSPDEAVALATALLTVEREFGLQMSPRAAALGGLAAACASIYQPRLGAERARATRNAQHRQQQPQQPQQPQQSPGRQPQQPADMPRFRGRPAQPGEGAGQGAARPPGADEVAQAGVGDRVVTFPTGSPDGGRIDLSGAP